MTKENIRLRIAENLGMLASDSVTVREGDVTITGINNRIDDIYRDDVWQLLSNKYPLDFVQQSADIPTYTAVGVVDTPSGTVLTATSAIFDNTMVGAVIENSTDSETATITEYTSSTQVTVDGDISGWAGDTIYVLNNEYIFNGDLVDLKEVYNFKIKYSATDQYYAVGERRNKNDLYVTGAETYVQNAPYWYLTTIDVAGVNKRGIGFVPAPTSYQGKFQIQYIERPRAMSDSDEPEIVTAGVSEVIIYGVTAWGKRLQKLFDEAAVYDGLYREAKANLINNYKPKAKSGAKRMLYGSYVSRVGRSW